MGTHKSSLIYEPTASWRLIYNARISSTGEHLMEQSSRSEALHISVAKDSKNKTNFNSLPSSYYYWKQILTLACRLNNNNNFTLFRNSAWRLYLDPVKEAISKQVLLVPYYPSNQLRFITSKNNEVQKVFCVSHKVSRQTPTY